jgi:hypothetical protein
MGWISNLFGEVPKEEIEGIHLDVTQSYWEVDGPKTFQELFNALQGWISEEAILYFEGGSPDIEINNFMATYSVQEQEHIAMGTIWSHPKVFHVPATATILAELTRIMDHHAESELAVHFHVYHNKLVLIEWHDAFSQPILISCAIPEQQVKVFADKIGKTSKRLSNKALQTDARCACAADNKRYVNSR